MRNLNICKNCKFWNFAGLYSEIDPYRVCTNPKVFKTTPETLHHSNKMLNGKNDEVVLPIDEINQYSKVKHIATGSNFGCIHFEST